jgi:acetate---CoA ligase (ADP-forming)
MTPMNLAPLLEPRSIAVVGATARDSYAGGILRNLQRADFEGEVWGVNPKHDEVLGFTCVPSLADLPQPVDAVVVAIPAAGVPAVVAEAGELGCGGAVVISAGFGEIEAGRALEADLREAALAHSLPVCGPNGNGIVAARARAAMWGDSVKPLEPGAVAMVTQSGNVGVNALGSQRGIRWHTVVSTGNQTVCDASDWLGALAVLDGVRSVALFLESDGDGDRLAEALALCAEHGVGVAVLKVGSSEAGTIAAAAHTGSLIGDQRVFRALVDEAGAAWAENPHELLELARVLAEPDARPRESSGRSGLAVLTCSGGDSGVAADEAERLGIDLPPLGPATRGRLEELLPPAATIANPLDYTAMIWGDSDRLARIIQAVSEDAAIDQLLLCYDHPHDMNAESERSWAAVRAGIVQAAATVSSGTLVCSTLPDLIDETAIEELDDDGVPLVAGIATALRCVRALREPGANAARMREIAAAAAHAARVDNTSDNGWIGEAEAKNALRDFGVPVPDGRLASDPGDAAAAARELGWPVALKLTGAALRHKSDAGALALDVVGDEDVEAQSRRLLALPESADAELLVERMADPGVELLVAATTDGVVPALVIGLGGIWAEALDDVAIVPLPASPERVERALRSLRGAALLTGGRGREPVDLAALATLGANAGRMLLDEGLALLELNPVVATPAGAVALDAVARRG